LDGRTWAAVLVKGLIFKLLVEQGIDIAEYASKSQVKRSSRREPLAFMYFGLLLFLFVYFLRPQDWVPGLASVPLAKITGFLMLVALVFSFSNVRWRVPKEVIFLCLLVIQLWLTIPFSPVWRGGAYELTLYFTKVLPVVVVMYGTVRSMKRLRGILFVQAASVAVVAIASVVVARVSSGRLRGVLSGIYGNSNDLALIIDLSLPICLAFLLTARSNWKKIAWSVVMLAMIYAVFLTASRSGAITLIVVALICLWQIGVKNRLFSLLLLIPVAAIVIWVYGGNSLRQRFEQTNMDPAGANRSTEAFDSAQQRKQLLIQSLKITAEHPLFGVGPGNFPVVSGVWRVTHNSYTQISSEGGIPALILYLLIFWRGIVNVRDIRRYPKADKRVQLFSMALGASLAAYLVGSIFASVAYQLFPYCLIAYTSALRFIAQRDRTASSLVPTIQPPPVEAQSTVWQ
jgi:O-antigen ligase